MSEEISEARDLQARVVELEVKLGFAEDLLDSLNRHVFRQQEQIEMLQRQLIGMHKQMQNQAGEGPGDPRDEVPPHY
jgi:SlyX protein